MSYSWGKNIKVEIFGASHDEHIKLRLLGIEKGFLVEEELIKAFLLRRTPTDDEYSTKRKETDDYRIVCGVKENVTTGEAIEVIFKNKDVRKADYASLSYIPRPSHADYGAYLKTSQIPSGGGSFSARMTLPLCFAGIVALRVLEQKGITITSHILGVGEFRDENFNYCEIDKNLCRRLRNVKLPLICEEKTEELKAVFKKVRNEKNSVGSSVEVAAINVPGGIGGALFEGLEGKISSIMFAIPAVKGIEFGNAIYGATQKGSNFNDCFYYDENREVKTKTNNCGGILGGISNNMPLVAKVYFKPIPSIGIKQDSVDLKKKENTVIEIHGRHDICALPRALPAVESALALAILDTLLQESKKNTLCSVRCAIDVTDEEIVSLLKKRTSLAYQIAQVKKQNSLAVLDGTREREILTRLASLCGEENKELIEEIYPLIFAFSKKLQNKKDEKK